MKKVTTTGLSKVEVEQLTSYLSVCMPDVEIASDAQLKFNAPEVPKEAWVHPDSSEASIAAMSAMMAGYRILSVNEILIPTDEYYFLGQGKWVLTCAEGNTVHSQVNESGKGHNNIGCYRRKK